MKTIILCADDYGQNTDISQGIIELVKHKRLSAVSCMTNSKAWPEHAAALKPLADQIDVGLHFNLTEGCALAPAFKERYGAGLISLPKLMLLSLMRLLDKKVIEQECRAQLASFITHMQRVPDFIDGHQHIHQFPQIREAVIQVFKDNLTAKHSYIRCVNQNLNWQDFLHPRHIKKCVIHLLGTRQMQKILTKEKILHNNHFGGIYSLAQTSDYPQLFGEFLRKINAHGLIMCHPGLQSTDPEDAIAATRYHEYQYLASEQFLQDCRANQVEIRRGQGIFSV